MVLETYLEHEQRAAMVSIKERFFKFFIFDLCYFFMIKWLYPNKNEVDDIPGYASIEGIYIMSNVRSPNS